MKALDTASCVLLIVGGLNWGLSAFGWNVVHMLLGSWPTVEMIVYVLVGLSAIWMLVSWKRMSASSSMAM